MTNLTLLDGGTDQPFMIDPVDGTKVMILEPRRDYRAERNEEREKQEVIVSKFVDDMRAAGAAILLAFVFPRTNKDEAAQVNGVINFGSPNTQNIMLQEILRSRH